MSTRSTLPKYYQRHKDIRKQLPTLLPIIIMFLATVLYASGFRNPTVRIAFYYMSLIYPAVILFSLSFTILKIHYFQLDSKGVYITLFGFIHKSIYWSSIGTIGKATIGNVEGTGMMYKPTVRHYVFGRKMRRKMFGWDEILADANSEDGKSLLKEVTKSYKAYHRRTK